MDRGVDVVSDEAFTDQDSVFVVEAFPGHEADQDVGTESQFTVIGRRTVGDDLAFLHFVADFDERTLIDAGSWFERSYFVRA